MNRDDRLLTDREVAEVICRATELQDSAGGDRPTDGVPLRVLREIASEIGIAQAYLDQAAGMVLDVPPSRRSSLLGGPIREELRFDSPRTLSDTQIRTLVDHLRATVGREGRISSSIGTVEWAAADLSVLITPAEDATHVRVIGDRGRSIAPTVVIPLAACLTLAGVAADTLQLGDLAAFAMLGGGGAAGLGIARAFWTATTGAFRARLTRVRAEITRFMDLEQPGAS